MVSIIENQADIQAGLAELARLDPRLAAAIAGCGDIPLRRSAGGFAGLASIVVSQQVSVASARAIWARFAAGFPAMDAAAIARASDADFQACGLSMPKIRTLRAIAEAVGAGNLPLDKLDALSFEEAHAALTHVKGVGPWTADIYLLTCIGHADAFPAGDLALQEAARLALGLPARPDAKSFIDISQVWRPWRAVAARLLWRYYAQIKQRDGAPSTA